MARYIDADALEKSVRAYADRKFFCGEVELANGILKSLAMVKQAPTADVAPVVRCQGCELCKPQDIKNTYDNRTERGLFCHYWQQKVYPDDFCSYGERKVVE